MTRGAGFAIADTDTGMLADRKVLALARRLHDPIRTGAAIALYDAVRLASWKDGNRLTLEETIPGWWLDPYEDLAVALVEAELLDAERRIPVSAWRGWFEAAWNRRQRYRELGAKGGQTSHPPNRTLDPTLKRTLDRTVEPPVSVRSTPYSSVTDPSVPPARARETVANATNEETTGCIRCHGPATDGNPFVTLADGRVKHRFNPCPGAAEVDWIAGAEATEVTPKKAPESLAEGTI
jgi:hypothetical protein